MTVTVLAYIVGDTFWDIKAINIATVAGIVLAFLRYRRDKQKDDQERQESREAMERRQEERHQDNQRKFDALIRHQQDQIEVNRKRDVQIEQLKVQTAELKLQTAILSQMADTLKWRMERLEDMDGK